MLQMAAFCKFVTKAPTVRSPSLGSISASRFDSNLGSESISPVTPGVPMLETMMEHPEEKNNDKDDGTTYHTVPNGESTAVLVESPKEEKNDGLSALEPVDGNAAIQTAEPESAISSSSTPSSPPSSAPALAPPSPVLTRKTSVPVLRRLSASVFRRRRGSDASGTSVVSKADSALSGLSKADSDLPEQVKPWSKNKSEFPDLETHGTKSETGYAGHAYVYADVGVSSSPSLQLRTTLTTESTCP